MTEIIDMSATTLLLYALMAAIGTLLVFGGLHGFAVISAASPPSPTSEQKIFVAVIGILLALAIFF